MTTLRIENMHCAACIRRVTRALSTLPAIRIDDIRLGSARIETTASSEEILHSMQVTGFPTYIDSDIR